MKLWGMIRCLCRITGLAALVVAGFATGWLGAQAGPIFLTNASFEGKPQDATVPVGWLPCEQGTTPDILPGPWGVYTEPSAGRSFVGLITREDGTWESICQRLPRTIQPKDCYTFTLDLAHSSTYAGYDQPVKLRIWAGGLKCRKDQILLETDLIDHAEWQTYEVSFTAKSPANYLLIEAFYNDSDFSHRGNILVDNISPIKKCVRAWRTEEHHER